MRKTPIFVPALLVLLAPALAAAQDTPRGAASDAAPGAAELVPDATNYRDWADFIQPSDDELSYEKIGWRNRFWPAVEEARRLGRPLLLWTMNGHPLGCT